MDSGKTSGSIQIHALAEWARIFVKDLPLGTRVGFIGPLGAGKTTLIRAIVHELGSPDPVSSPSFVLAHEYSSPRGTIEHWDLYRLTQVPEQLLDSDPNSIRLVEWADKFPELVEALDCCCQLSRCAADPENTRSITVCWKHKPSATK